MGEVIFNGQSSRSFCLEVETFPEYKAPKRTYSKIHVPGRNGDLIVDGGCWENVPRTYLFAIGSYDIPYYMFINKLSNWLHSSTTYARLEDSYEPDYYRMAVFLEESTMTNIYNHGSEISVDFDCKPERFLKIGDEPITITTTPTTIKNPTGYRALPIITVYGSGTGTLVVGNCTVTFTSINSKTTLDSTIQDAYNGLNNMNPYIKVPNGFPTLDPGLISIGYSGGITKVEVIPKWFTL